ncbi:hypothetical protein NBRC116602_28890 [Hyphomicrobiales bacterium 4NK60-0047b]
MSMHSNIGFSEKQYKIVLKKNILAFPYFWQVPAETEKAAYETILDSGINDQFDYLAFPWATIIDGVRNDASIAYEILINLKKASSVNSLGCKRRATVAQHIHADHFVDLFKACGITDLFWSHATKKISEIGGIRLHPFPLFPAQTPKGPTRNLPNNQRKYLANFIGAYNPSIYLSNVRDVILKDTNKYGDLLIIKRGAWHFDRAVYQEQIRGVAPGEQKKLQEEAYKEEYLSAIKNSWFTLCPTGSGPNSIRIFESLCLGSIPIVLTKDLKLVGDETLWQQACIIEEDSADGYSRAIKLARNAVHARRMELIENGRILVEKIKPSSFADIIIDAMKEH